MLSHSATLCLRSQTWERGEGLDQSVNAFDGSDNGRSPNHVDLLLRADQEMTDVGPLHVVRVICSKD